MKISAGVIITNIDDSKILLGHITGSEYWSIPKGVIDPGENPFEACVREVKEETGLILNAVYLEDLGVFDYLKNKMLYLFKCTQFKILPLIDTMKCTSYFEKNGKLFPELDDFKFVEISELEKYTSKNMFKTLSNALSN